MARRCSVCGWQVSDTEPACPACGSETVEVGAVQAPPHRPQEAAHAHRSHIPSRPSPVGPTGPQRSISPAAAVRRDMTLFLMLIEAGADIEYSGAVSGGTALHEFLNYGDMIQTLLEHNANVNARDRGGRTPLHLAARNKSLWQCELFVRCGADPHIKDLEGNTPLMVARGRACRKFLQSLP